MRNTIKCTVDSNITLNCTADFINQSNPIGQEEETTTTDCNYETKTCMNKDKHNQSQTFTSDGIPSVDPVTPGTKHKTGHGQIKTVTHNTPQTTKSIAEKTA